MWFRRGGAANWFAHCFAAVVFDEFKPECVYEQQVPECQSNEQMPERRRGRWRWPGETARVKRQQFPGGEDEVKPRTPQRLVAAKVSGFLVADARWGQVTDFERNLVGALHYGVDSNARFSVGNALFGRRFADAHDDLQDLAASMCGSNHETVRMIINLMKANKDFLDGLSPTVCS